MATHHRPDPDPRQLSLLAYTPGSPFAAFGRPSAATLNAITRYRLQVATKQAARRNAGQRKRRPTGDQFLRGSLD